MKTLSVNQQYETEIKRLRAINATMLEALEQIVWKLNRKEMDGDKCILARIDSRDVVIHHAAVAIAAARGEA